MFELVIVALFIIVCASFYNAGKHFGITKGIEMGRDGIECLITQEELSDEVMKAVDSVIQLDKDKRAELIKKINENVSKYVEQ